MGSLGCCRVLVVGAVGAISMPGASSSTPRLSYRPAKLHNGAVLLIMSFIFSWNIKKRPRFGRLAIEMLGGGQGSRGKSRDWEKTKRKKKRTKAHTIAVSLPIFTQGWWSLLQVIAIEVVPQDPWVTYVGTCLIPARRMRRMRRVWDRMPKANLVVSDWHTPGLCLKWKKNKKRKIFTL